MADRLVISDLAVQCRLGVDDWEQEKPQAIWIDLELAIDAARAARRDDVREAVDYARLVASVKQLAQSRPFRLVETLAESIASLVLDECGVARVRVRVKKRALPEIGYAAIEIERTRRVLRPSPGTPAASFGEAKRAEVGKRSPAKRSFAGEIRVRR